LQENVVWMDKIYWAKR